MPRPSDDPPQVPGPPSAPLPVLPYANKRKETSARFGMPLWGQMAFGGIFGLFTVASTLLLAEYSAKVFALLPLILFALIASYVHYKWDWRGFWIGILLVLFLVFLASFVLASL
ncbi:MAG TPA: hypothetical protein VGQ99_10810 [Tepidisphaeraceae bacterium]|jgi:hypothetical protein|nr:hypothetical protein [Tepidisphaeraceae bacterium]